MKVLVTGAAGFIGYSVAKCLLDRGDKVIGWDNLNDYYDVNLKTSRLDQLLKHTNFTFTRLDIADKNATAEAFKNQKPERVIHLAAQAGVRYSLQNPHAYVDSNVVGYLNVLEGCRHQSVEHLVYASTSSVYGGNKKLPLAVEDRVDHPYTLYAATKRANELMAHSYSHLYHLAVTGLRFFTVYGPWGRPDMALFLFTKNMLQDKPIDVFNYGNHRRDFTYIDDIVNGIVKVLDRIPELNPEHGTRYQLYNIGNHGPVNLIDFIEAIEECLGKKAVRNMLPMQAGDILETFADISSLQRDTGFEPKTSVKEGVKNFIAWYRQFYKV